MWAFECKAPSYVDLMCAGTSSDTSDFFDTLPHESLSSPICPAAKPEACSPNAQCEKTSTDYQLPRNKARREFKGKRLEFEDEAGNTLKREEKHRQNARIGRSRSASESRTESTDTSNGADSMKKVSRVIPKHKRRSKSLDGTISRNRDKFMSFAEHVKLFEKTPPRFRSLSKKDAARGPPPSNKKTNVMMITTPRSPKLRALARKRSISVLSSEDRDATELKKIRKSGANPKSIPVRAFSKTTVPEPFNLSGMQRKDDPSVFNFTASHKKCCLSVPRKHPHPEKRNINKRKTDQPLLANHEDEDELCDEFGKGTLAKNTHTQDFWHRSCVNHFSKEDMNNTLTVTKPFSFEERDKLMLQQKEQKIKQALEERQKSRDFHARPMPDFRAPNLPDSQEKTLIEQVPFHLLMEERSRLKQEKLKEEMEKMEQEKRAARIFKAQSPTVLRKDPFVATRPERLIAGIQDVQLNTQKRAEKRHEFDMRIKLKELEAERARLEREREMMELLQEQIAELRKETVHKAQPAPNNKPMRVIPSVIPLTEPSTPRCLKRHNLKQNNKEPDNE